MQLRDLSIENLHIPFKVSFQHSSSSRTKTEAILVKATTEDGNQGLGEGCPREYVTGETLETAHQFFNTYYSDFLTISSLDELKIWVAGNQSSIDKNPAAFCAVELALLNALAKEKNVSVEALLSLPELCGNFQYTAVLGVSKVKVFQAQLQQYVEMGFSDFKIKLFGIPEIDHANNEAIREYDADNIRIRFDANNLWTDAGEAVDYIKHLDHSIFALEEPLEVYQYADLLKVFNQLKVKIILDESFTKEADFEPIRSHPESWIINLRISKMGGILRSLAIANKARFHAIPIIIGAQVGETSILTRAALTVANANRDILLAQEGAFGTYLLDKDVIDPSIKFGVNGIVDADQL